MKSPALVKLLVLSLIFVPWRELGAEQKLPSRADIEQKLNAQIPRDLKFRDETGQIVPFSTYFGKRPVILQMGYYKCWLLCDVVTGGLVRSLQEMRLTPGKDFEIVFVSIDPREDWKTAARKKAEYVKLYGRDEKGVGWHFLTGDESQIKALAQAVGFHYFYDNEARQFAHGSGVMVLTPGERLSRYFYGIEFDPKSLRLALVQASNGKIGTPVDTLLLLCYHWNPLTGKYGLLISRVITAGCVVTVGLLGSFIAFWLWREKVRNRSLGGTVPV